MIRPAAVAGRFYPAQPERLSETLRGFIQPAGECVRATGIVVPHAGYMYSGHVAGAVYARIQIPERAVVLCPNHTGHGPPLSIMRSGAWATPLGEMQIDSEFCDALIASDPYFEDDILAHRFEHALEVQLPFIQHLAGPLARLVPITVGTSNWHRLEEMGTAIAEAVLRIDRDALIIASSDMNHYESDAITRIKDYKAIDRILDLDARGLFDVVKQERISMCGYGPTVAMLIASKKLGATKSDLVKYATSGDVSGDFDHVVGYAGMMIY